MKGFMTFGTNKLEIFKLIISPILVNMMNFQSTSYSADGAKGFQFVESQPSIRPSSIFVLRTIVSKKQNFKWFSRTRVRAKASLSPMWLNYEGCITGFALFMKSGLRIFSFHSFLQHLVFTRLRATFAMTPRERNYKFFFANRTN